jgi:putative intracellular protease/amidase
VLRADAAGRAAYAQLTDAPEFAAPMRWDAIDLEAVDGLLLPGGHRARGMRPYLESTLLQAVIVQAFQRDLPVAAVCHGVLLVARSVDPDTGRSVLHGRRTTSLAWHQERMAASIGRVVRFWEPAYYRTYPDPATEPAGHMSVQSEVTRALARPEDFVDVDTQDSDARVKNDGRHRDRSQDSRPAHVVVDGNYVSARWPGDVHTFAQRFSSILERARQATSVQ